MNTELTVKQMDALVDELMDFTFAIAGLPPVNSLASDILRPVYEELCG